MDKRFDYFVIFAEMRTGSNFLETNINAFDGLQCYGEAFNPHFIGYPNRTEILGVSQAEREQSPENLILRIKSEPGVMGGFRFFHDHDPRVIQIALDDPRCAKVVLTRNPLDSYISWKIAKATGQWKLTDVRRRKEALPQFEAGEFARYLETLQDFQVTLLNRFQATGQTAFYIAYEDIGSLEVMNGLAKWLGVDESLSKLDSSLKRQNPGPVTAKVSNPEQMLTALSGIDRFNLTRTPNFEPRRGPAVPSYVAGVDAPLIYMPMRGGPEAEVVAWMAAIEGIPPKGLHSKMNQKDLRQWKRRHPGHRSFTVLRHPVLHAHSVFCSRILHTNDGAFVQIRETLRKQFKLDIPKDGPNNSYTLERHKAAFLQFLHFVKQNLAGQTSVRIDGAWSTQAHVIQNFADFILPDHILREDEMFEALPRLAGTLGMSDPVKPSAAQVHTPFSMDDVYDQEVEDAVSDIYQKDYVMFGFRPYDPVF